MMTRFYHSAVLGIALSALVACNGQSPPPPRPAAVPPPELLNHLVERYWDENAALRPWYSWGSAEMHFGAAPTDALAAQALADSLAIERRYLAGVLDIPRATLSPESKVTYDMFLRERRLTIESFTYPAELLPVNPFDSVPQEFALMASAAERYGASSDKDLANWQVHAESYVQWTNQAIANLRDGMRRGYTLPRVLVERMLPQLAALGEDAPANIFYLSLHADGNADPRAAGLASVLKEKVLPAYRALHDFLQREYLPRSRDSVGLSALPLGESWYVFLVKRATGIRMPPGELHDLNAAEVDRLRARMRVLLADTAFAGNAAGFLDSMRHDPRFSYGGADELTAAYQELKTQTATAAPPLFPVPRADFEMRSVETFRAATAPPLAYRPSTAFGKNSAVLYLDTADLENSPATAGAARFLREAVPGHHYQLALQRERVDLPRFRRFGGVPAFIEGWGLYAVSLGEELGVYHDSEAKFGALLVELECAAGAVIDTGLHWQHWTRQQALDYLHAQTPVDGAEATNIVDRAIAMPAEALACTVGLAKFQDLRARAQQTLAGRFDLHAFHTELLEDGAVPLDILESRINQWMVTAAKVD